MLNRIATPVKCRGRQWHSRIRQIVPSCRMPRRTRRFISSDRDSDFTAENFYTISTDTHIDHLVILLAGAHKNATGTVHFQPLLDQNLLLARGHAMGNHPSRAASGGGARGGIVSAIKKHAGVEAGFGVDRFAANEVKELSAARREIFAAAAEIKAKILQRLERTQRCNSEGNTGGNGLNGRGAVEVSDAQTRKA